jgi:hypothetical protein
MRLFWVIPLESKAFEADNGKVWSVLKVFRMKGPPYAYNIFLILVINLPKLIKREGQQ